MKETRVYVVNVDKIEDVSENVSDKEFMSYAEEQGTVYTLEGFENEFNNTPFSLLSTEYDVIRFIEVEVEDENINVELQEDCSTDVVVNNELEVHIKRNDVGYSVDLYKHKDLSNIDDDYDFDSDFITGCCAYDDDIREVEND